MTEIVALNRSLDQELLALMRNVAVFVEDDPPPDDPDLLAYLNKALKECEAVSNKPPAPQGP